MSTFINIRGRSRALEVGLRSPRCQAFGVKPPKVKGPLVQSLCVQQIAVSSRPMSSDLWGLSAPRPPSDVLELAGSTGGQDLGLAHPYGQFT